MERGDVRCRPRAITGRPDDLTRVAKVLSTRGRCKVIRLIKVRQRVGPSHHQVDGIGHIVGVARHIPHDRVLMADLGIIADFKLAVTISLVAKRPLAGVVVGRSAVVRKIDISGMVRFNVDIILHAIQISLTVGNAWMHKCVTAGIRRRQGRLDGADLPRGQHAGINVNFCYLTVKRFAASTSLIAANSLDVACERGSAGVAV